MIPDPDYSDSEEENNHNSFKNRPDCSGSSNVAHFSEGRLVLPKKIGNPCMESTERQSLHRELLFNQKMGKSVLGQKTELKKVMEKFRDEHKKKEMEEERLSKRSALEKKLEAQANKLKQQEDETRKGEVNQPEFLRVHARVCAQMPVDSHS